MNRIVRMILPLAILILFPILATASGEPQPAAPNPQPALRIGTFDSRIVALAWWNSAGARAEVKAMREDLARAERENDTEKIKELKSLGPSRQHLSHQQVFSNASIVDIVPHFRDALPGIAARHGVAAVVSKWEIPYAAASVETVDVTDDIVALFSPDERTLKFIEGARKIEPIPLQNLVYDPEH